MSLFINYTLHKIILNKMEIKSGHMMNTFQKARELDTSPSNKKHQKFCLKCWEQSIHLYHVYHDFWKPNVNKYMTEQIFRNSYYFNMI